MAHGITYSNDGRVLRVLGDGGELDTGFTWLLKSRRVVLYQDRGAHVFGSYGDRSAATRAILRYLSWAGLPKQETSFERIERVEREIRESQEIMFAKKSS